MRKQVYRIGKGKSSLFKTEKAIAHPENRIQLRKDVRRCELLGETRDGKKIYLYRHQSESSLMREIGRLREQAFRMVGEGTGDRRDVDSYDNRYEHIVLWDDEQLEIVGAYRLFGTGECWRQGKPSDIYSHSLFQFGEDMDHILEQGLELGRSFVQPKYWGTRSLEYLWYGIAAYLNRHPQYRYLIGPVSISNSFSKEAKDMLVYYYEHFYGSAQNQAMARLPYVLDSQARSQLDSLFGNLDRNGAFRILKSQLNHMGYAVPTLYKQYSELCEAGGAQFLSFNIDPDFGDCIDGLVVVDIDKICASKAKRYHLMPRNQEQAA